ncbi:MAG: hypothetical protein GF320_04945 [Armatimonadia bacterium]|nr:hypothetical protein [Armatimonadia bacterium]
MEIETSDGVRLPLEGYVFRTSYAAGLLLKASEPVDLPLEEMVAVVGIRWPPGVMGCGTSLISSEGTGRRFAHRVLDSTDRQGERLDEVHTGFWWPFGVSCWSDGEWVALSIMLVSERMSERPQITHGWDFRAGYSPFSPAAMLEAERERGLGTTLEPVASLSEQTLAGLGVQSQPIDDCLSAVRPYTGGVLDLGVHLLPRREWEGASPRPVPARVREFLGLGAHAEGLAIHLNSHPYGGPADVGLLRMPNVSRGLNGGLVVGDRVAQWALGDGWLALTVVSTQAARLCGTVGARCEHLPSEKGMLAAELVEMLGPCGRSLTLVPMDIQEDYNGRGLLLTPRADAPHGLHHEDTVGEQPWGRCTIYADPSILHIVFDLPDEDEG